MHGKPLFAADSSFFRRILVLDATARNTTKLCHMFGSQPDVKIFAQN